LVSLERVYEVLQSTFNKLIKFKILFEISYTQMTPSV
jgi:hypothetical protein